MDKQNLGKLGEDLAQKYLQNKGYRFLKRNFRSKFGEIDLIFIDKQILVFVEVKTRFSVSFGLPEEAITSWKIRSIIKTAQYFVLLNPRLPDSLRIDAVAVELRDGKLKEIRHHPNITL